MAAASQTDLFWAAVRDLITVSDAVDYLPGNPDLVAICLSQLRWTFRVHGRPFPIDVELREALEASPHYAGRRRLRLTTAGNCHVFVRAGTVEVQAR